MGYSDDDLLEILTRSNWQCSLCHKTTGGFRLDTYNSVWHVDHTIPKAAGGSSKRGNLRAAHIRCNQVKSDSSLGTFLRDKEGLCGTWDSGEREPCRRKAKAKYGGHCHLHPLPPADA